MTADLLCVDSAADQRINTVVAKGLCTECGTCHGICPKNNIRVARNRHGSFRYTVKNLEKCGRCHLCIDICPGEFVDFVDLYTSVFGDFHTSATREPLGIYTDICLGQAADDGVHGGGATAGVTTALMIYALKKRIIDGVFVVQMGNADSGDPLEPNIYLARTPGEIIAGQQSKYTSVPMGHAFREIVYRYREINFGFIGLGCHIQALRKAEKLIPALKDRIALRVGLFCGHSMDKRGSLHLLRLVGALEDEVERIEYRYGAWPGSFSAFLKDGRRRDIGHIDWTGYVMTLYERDRCHFCTDPLNQLADISVGDPWVQELARCGGKNIVISRTETGRRILAGAVDEGILLTEAWNSTAALRSQMKTIYRKRHMIRAYMKLVGLGGQAVPMYQGQLTDEPLTAKDYVRAAQLEIARRIAKLELLKDVMPFAGKLFLRLKQQRLKRTSAWY